MKLLLFATLFIGIALLLLGLRVFFTRKGKFPETHIEANKALRKKGIGCANSQLEGEARRKNLFDRIEE